MGMVFQKILRGVLAACLLCTFDAHLPLLQTIAWTGMFVRNVQQEDVASALRDTFDGDHPCKLCHAIKVARETANESLTAPPVLRCDATLGPMVAGVLPPAPAFRPLFMIDDSSPLHDGEPPVPPPPNLARVS